MASLLQVSASLDSSDAGTNPQITEIAGHKHNYQQVQKEQSRKQLSITSVTCSALRRVSWDCCQPVRPWPPHELVQLSLFRYLA